LERGYSITRLNGRAVRSVTEVKAGDVVETVVGDGKLKSRVDSVEIG
jgi:exodeoxyribonuclease VII large subunit